MGLKRRVADLEGMLLDAAVARAEGMYFHYEVRPDSTVCAAARDLKDPSVPVKRYAMPFQPSIDWDVAGPIIERERIDLRDNGDGWHAGIGLEDHHQRAGIGSFGPTPLIAAMRAYVASKFGDEVELP